MGLYLYLDEMDPSDNHLQEIRHGLEKKLYTYLSIDDFQNMKEKYAQGIPLLGDKDDE